ncbi:argininosuccinate lyase [Lysobacter sp. GX 14042]|uniref:argininosuccinate lyase n=1 Tax=Lysobacter sp. GX 14042 TaxID=2907155 RepID=UPI001F4048AC|nr:argininosuccinate lyase [Lysobacter sp. GX 14042]MCE7032831.1 argininosuccinate lyase [Lysobacter sp. GX 14042]
MSGLLWQKPGVQVDGRIQAFCAGDDVILDREFFLFDIRASRAHAEGLQRIGILSADELEAIGRELDALAADFGSGAFVLDARYEDGHSAIEARLVERLGDTGRRIHTGRSRNDQVLVATRLWLKDRLARLQALCVEVAGVALDRAEAEGGVPLPGYTHLQRAVVSSLGMWWAAWAEGFIDNAARARDTLAWVDANPLGSAAGYGVNLPLDRDYTTRALGFGRMQVAATYAQLSRGKFEMAAIEALSSAVLDLRRLAWDLSLFTSAEFGFVSLPAQYTTGSSIMPNKRNPDVIELMRASHASVAAGRAEIEHLLSLPSGYHRDLQFSKGAIFHAFGRGLGALELLPDLLRNLEWRAEVMRAAIDGGMYATDVAVEQAAAGVPFREAYRAAAGSLEQAGEGRSPEASLQARVSPGAGAQPGLDVLRGRLRAWTSA